RRARSRRRWRCRAAPCARDPATGGWRAAWPRSNGGWPRRPRRKMAWLGSYRLISAPPRFANRRSALHCPRRRAMSFLPYLEPACTKESEPSVELEIDSRQRDLGDGFTVRRLLPSAARRTVGPFIFVDHMGPVHLSAGHGLDVRPHPHINLATVTFLFDGEIV